MLNHLKLLLGIMLCVLPLSASGQSTVSAMARQTPTPGELRTLDAAETQNALLDRIDKLEKRLAELESRSPAAPVVTSDVTAQQKELPNTTESTQPSQKPVREEPFTFADFTWTTGNPRTTESPIKTDYFTGEFRVDTNFTYSFNHPQDNTIGGSSEIFRHNEVQVKQLGVGGDFNYKK